jgi:hypothetical protein
MDQAVARSRRALQPCPPAGSPRPPDRRAPRPGGGRGAGGGAASRLAARRARALAHDDERALRSGLTPLELAALELLTRQAGESYELYILRIAYARGAAGRLARVVKLADLDDHIARPWVAGDPPYAWGRRHIAVGCARAA